MTYTRLSHKAMALAIAVGLVVGLVGLVLNKI